MSYLEHYLRLSADKIVGKGFKPLSAGNLHLRSHGLKSLVPDLVVFFGPSIAIERLRMVVSRLTNLGDPYDP